MAYSTREFKSFLPDHDGDLGTYRIKSQTGVAQFRYNFVIPDDYGSLGYVQLGGDVAPAAASSGQDIDLYISSHGAGEPETQRTASDTGTVYDLSAYSNKLYRLVFTDLLNTLNPNPGDSVGINVDHISLGGTIYYQNLDLMYYRRF